MQVDARSDDDLVMIYLVTLKVKGYISISWYFYLSITEACWSFEEKTFVKQSMILESEKCAQKVHFALTTLCCEGRGLDKA